MVYAGGMLDEPDLQHDINSRLASIKADLFLLEREVKTRSEKVKHRFQRLNQKMTDLHSLIKAIFHDIPETTD